MSFVVATVVEGDGEVQALPVLLRRLRPEFSYPRPIRVKRQRVVQEGNLKHYLQIALASIRDGGGHGTVLVLLDADDDCPAEVAPALQARGEAVCGAGRCDVVMPVREYEAWFVAGAVIEATQPPEQIGNPKVHVKSKLGRYSPTADQASLSARIDLEQATTTSPSFAKLRRVLNRFASLASSDQGEAEF